MTAGDRAVVIKSWHSDVMPGTEGVIAKEMDGGYALSVTGWFTDATGHRHARERCLFFAYTELRQIRGKECI